MRDIRHTEMPCEQGQVSLGGSIAFLLRVLPGFAPPLMHTPRWNTGDDEPRPALIFGSHDDSFLSHVALDSVQERDKLKGSPMPSNHFIDGRLMIEATEKIRSGCGKVSQGLDLKVPSIPEKQDAFLCSCYDGIDIVVIGNVPRRQCEMLKPTPFIVPYGLHVGTSFCSTPSRAWQEVFQAFRKSQSRTVNSIHLGKVCKETVITDFVEGLYFCQGFTDHFLKKDKSTFVHSLMESFRRPLELLSPLRHLRGQWRERRCGITPDANGDEGQKNLPRNFGSAFDKASPTSGVFDVVRGEEFGEHRQCTGRLFRHRSLLCTGVKACALFYLNTTRRLLFSSAIQ